MQRRELSSGVIYSVDLRKRAEPRLATLLPHDPSRPPGGQRVVESLVRSANGLFAGQWNACVVKAGKIAHPVVRRRRHHPRITTIAQHVREAIVVLEQVHGLRRERRIHSIPVNAVSEVDIEICYDRLALFSHVSARRKISLLDVLQLGD